MNSPQDSSGWFGPVVEIWIDDTSDGHAVFVTGERSDGQQFLGSFYQPTLDHDSDGGPEL